MNNDELRLLKSARYDLAYLMREIRTNPDNISIQEVLGWLVIIYDLLDMYD